MKEEEKTSETKIREKKIKKKKERKRERKREGLEERRKALLSRTRRNIQKVRVPKLHISLS